ncbi:hypothetical protein GS415_11840, partial [Rhodococcus hoagii]|nr:hypothetical protein [Prescottella equi]
RPPANAFDPALIAELLSVLPPLAADPDVRCIVVRGEGRFFVAWPTSASCVSSPRRRSVRCGRGPMCRAPRVRTRKPVVAALNGHALGGRRGTLPRVRRPGDDAVGDHRLPGDGARALPRRRWQPATCPGSSERIARSSS